MKTKSNKWVFSDPHFFHKNLVRGVSNWTNKDGCRDFNTIEEHNNAIIETTNKYVKEDDILYCLGDWSFGGVSNIWEARKRIKCNNIILVLGNHDKSIRMNRTLPNCAHTYIESNTLPPERKINGQYLSSCNSDLGAVRPEELFKEVHKILYTKVDSKTVVMSHEAFEVWRDRHKGAFHLHGHHHNVIPSTGRRLDVTIESAINILGEPRPFNWDEIVKLLEHREIETNEPIKPIS